MMRYALLLLLLFTGCAIGTRGWKVHHKTVTDKTHRGAWVQIIPAGKAFAAVPHREQFFVICGDDRFEVDKKLFDVLVVGDKVKITQKIGFYNHVVDEQWIEREP